MSDEESLKKYCVVKIFSNEINKTVYPVVPSKWINDESECFFPESLKITSSIEKKVEKCYDHDALWPTFPIIVMTTTGKSPLKNVLQKVSYADVHMFLFSIADNYEQAVRRSKRAVRSEVIETEEERSRKKSRKVLEAEECDQHILFSSTKVRGKPHVGVVKVGSNGKSTNNDDVTSKTSTKPGLKPQPG